MPLEDAPKVVDVGGVWNRDRAVPEESFDLSAEDVGIEVFLAVEVVIHRSFGDPGGGDDAVDGRVGEPVGGELIECGVEDSVALFG